MIFGAIFTIVAIALDQLTKFLVYGSVARSIIGNFLWFSSTLNTGVAFSMFEGQGIVLSVVAAIACVAFAYLIFSKRFFNSKLQKSCLGLILGGTFSNLLDRFIFGGVRDFIYLKFINYAIFNVADMAIVCGVIILCISVIVEVVRQSKEKNKETKETNND